jgi:tetratricopeptide (TPR) repeat protein/DNA-binding winged helix-turn-helix (wHTH) protein/TolB-like protein
MDTNSSRNDIAPTLRVGELELYPDAFRAVRSGEEIPIRQQTMRVLLHLIDQRGRVVSRDELHATIWGDTAVTPDALVQCIVEIRKVLGDSAKEPKYIRTVQKIGYSYVGPAPSHDRPAPAPIEPVAVAPAPVAPPIFAHRTPWERYAAFASTLILLLSIAAPARLAVTMPKWSGDSGRKRLLLVPFTNASGAASVAWLQNGLPNMLVTGLGRSSSISAVTVADADEGRSIARTAHADAVVSGSFAFVGDTLRVDVRLESGDGSTLATDVIVARRQDAVLSEVDRLAERLIARVGGQSPALATTGQVADVMTRDLDAYRDYILGIERANAVEPDAAIQLFERAIARDPEFAMAHARIGATYAVTIGAADKAQPYLKKAFQLSDRLRERDRLWILAWYALANVDYDGAIKPLETLIDESPGDTEPYAVLGNIYVGQEQWTAAADVINRGLLIRPDDKDLLNQASAVATLLGQRDAALDTARRYVALAPQEANAYDSLGLRLQHFGQYDEALDAFEQASRLNPKFTIGYAHAGNVYFAQGRYREARAAYERFVEAAVNDGDRARAYGALAWIAYRGGDGRQARLLADRSVSLSKWNWWPASVLALERGDVKTYERIRHDADDAGKFSNRGKPFPPIIQHYMSSLDLISAGRTEQALAELREAVKHPRATWSIDPTDDCLAERLLALGRYDDARTEFGRLVAAQPWAGWYHFRLAEIAEHAGDAALTRLEFQEFLKLWPKADPDVPAVAKARERLTLASR